MQHVVIGHNYFRKSLGDYADWKNAWVRETGQNSQDSGAAVINYRITSDGQTTQAAVDDDGCGMTETVLTEKFLALGETTKERTDCTGSFGIAKLVIALAHQSYSIHTGNLLVRGSGGAYMLKTTVDRRTGTAISVTMAGNLADELSKYVRQFVALSQLKAKVYLNGELLEDRLLKGRHRRDLPWCKIYTNRQYHNLLVVRLNGQCMFTREVSHDGCVVVELTGKSSELLTSNRDGLLWQYQRELDNFVTQLAVDRHSALRPPAISRIKFDGYRISGSTKAAENLATPEAVTTTPIASGSAAALVAAGPCAQSAGHDEVITTSRLSLEFHIKNETNLKIAPYFLPGNFSGYARTLAERWANCLICLRDILDYPHPFAVGFVFSEDSEAQYEEHDNRRIFLINPAKVVGGNGKPRAFQRAWTFAPPEHWRLVATASHEFVHALGYALHNESFSAELTRVLGLVLQNRSRFGAIFGSRGAIKWPE